MPHAYSCLILSASYSAMASSSCTRQSAPSVTEKTSACFMDFIDSTFMDTRDGRAPSFSRWAFFFSKSPFTMATLIGSQPVCAHTAFSAFSRSLASFPSVARSASSWLFSWPSGIALMASDSFATASCFASMAPHRSSTTFMSVVFPDEIMPLARSTHSRAFFMASAAAAIFSFCSLAPSANRSPWHSSAPPGPAAMMPPTMPVAS
mmetsp:Transcript_28381/g.72045  ORF Transcript_28381/g.72045 Transcript_28381/m.72045 type:complete len:206 (-) Transcript_28381:2903-3520(-)